VAPGIPVGDLFVAMESWEEPERIKASMDVILEIEAEAAKGVQGKEGLMELLQMLSTSDVKVALVTRNTHNRCALQSNGGSIILHYPWP
jgi:hypothetical protein